MRTEAHCEAPSVNLAGKALLEPQNSQVTRKHTTAMSFHRLDTPRHCVLPCFQQRTQLWPTIGVDIYIVWELTYTAVNCWKIIEKRKRWDKEVRKL